MDIRNELLEQVQQAAEKKEKLLIRGLGSKDFLGRPGIDTANHTVLSLKNHQGIISYKPEELVMTARAGTALEEIESALNQNGQTMAFEPPRFNRDGSIGGTLACNLSGPRRPWVGSVRDAVLGIGLIDGKAQSLRFGGQVMKNVAGFDVSRTQAGAMGCLGVITEISFKVLPKASMSKTLCLNCEADFAIPLMRQLIKTPLPISACSWYEHKLWLRLEGSISAVKEATALIQCRGNENWQLEDDLDCWQAIRDLSFFDFTNKTKLLWRFSIKASTPHADLQHALNHQCTNQQGTWVIDWGGSQRWLVTDADHAQERKTTFESLAETAGGEVTLFNGSAVANVVSEVFHSKPKLVQNLHLRIKSAFDPNNMFNPGRLYSWL